MTAAQEEIQAQENSHKVNPCFNEKSVVNELKKEIQQVLVREAEVKTALQVKTAENSELAANFRVFMIITISSFMRI